MSESQVLQLTFPEPDVALLTFSDPNRGANILSQRVLDELSGRLDELEQRDDLAGLILASDKPGIFIAGADLTEFAQSVGQPAEKTVELCRKGQTLFQRLCQTPFVTVAAIDGVCVGGGAEVACWCDHRILSNSPKAQIGFPEVKLGLYPGWGGTVRSTRIVGLANAVELVTGGDSIDGAAAVNMGLAWDCVPSEQLLASAMQLVRHESASREFECRREAWRGGVKLTDTELMFLGATASAYITGKTKGQYPAPLAALEMMLEAAGLDAEAACVMEAEGMGALFGSPINRALLNVFFLSDRNKKDAGVAASGVETRPVASVGVIGAGIMGQGIASACVRRDVRVAITDARADAIGAAAASVLEEASYDKQAKHATVERMSEKATLINPTTSDAEIAACDLVIEAIIENADAKRELYARIEPLLPETALLASNTSTIPIAKLAESLARPDRFLGVHFFNPVRKMPLVEVIRGPATSDEAVVEAVAFAKRIGKSPVVVNDCPGFLVNRLLVFYMNEALELLLEGVPPQDVERAAKRFGMPMGPLTLYDVVGLDTAFYAGKVMYEAFPDRINPSLILSALVKAKRLGQKTGAGFFRYKDAKSKGEPDPDFIALLDKYRTGEVKKSREEIENRLMLPMLLEATRALAEGVARDARDIDLAMIYGVGFPPFRGGPLFWADALGADEVLRRLEPFAELGPRMQPTPLLEEIAKTGGSFYAHK